MANTITSTGMYIDNDCLGSSMILIGVEEYFEYRQNVKTDNRLGYRYSVILPGKSYEVLTVKIPGGKQIDVKGNESIPVTFDNLSVKPYIANRNVRPMIAYTATATAIHRTDIKS